MNNTSISKLLLMSTFALLFACKGSKKTAENKTEKPTETIEKNEDLETRIAKRKAQIEKKSLLIAKKEAIIDSFLKSKRKAANGKGIILVEKKEWADSIKNYIADKKAFEEKYPEAKLESFRKNNLYYRYFYGDPFALEKMIAIIESGNIDSINKLYRNLNEYKSGFEEEKLFSNQKLSSLIIESLENENLERNAIAVVINLKNGTEILETRLESGLSNYPQAILFRLSFEAESKIGLNHLEKIINGFSQIELSNSQIEKDLGYYIKSAANESIRQKAVELAIDYYLEKDWYSESGFYGISVRRYKYPATLEAYILHYGNTYIIPFLLKLQNEERTSIVDYKLWSLGYELSENKIDQLLNNKKLMVLMQKNDSKKQLLKKVDSFYKKTFQEILSSNKISKIEFWNDELYKVVYYYKDEEKEIFKKKIKEVLQAENQKPTEERKMLSKIMNWYSVANESKMDILDYFKSIGFITSDQHKQVAKQIRNEENEENDSQTLSDNFFEVMDYFDKYVWIFTDEFSYAVEALEINGNEIFDGLSFYANIEETENINGITDKKATEIVAVYNEKVYMMFPEKYSPTSYCSIPRFQDNFQDKFINFVNYILEQNNIKNRIVPYSIFHGCDYFRSYIGTKEQVRKITEKYEFITY